jgi:hypothetical protein
MKTREREGGEGRQTDKFHSFFPSLSLSSFSRVRSCIRHTELPIHSLSLSVITIHRLHSSLTFVLPLAIILLPAACLETA